jgi:hypothetical protein
MRSATRMQQKADHHVSCAHVAIRTASMQLSIRWSDLIYECFAHPACESAGLCRVREDRHDRDQQAVPATHLAGCNWDWGERATVRRQVRRVEGDDNGESSGEMRQTHGREVGRAGGLVTTAQHCERQKPG